ncbi:MAG TPA: hypothetical protein EYN91_03190 [Candidatus Melainabacteria bacterium]|nr:hypothetical protein [Candidatus Melainabacteria bacterium]
MRILIRLGLMALAFAFILPQIHGNFAIALVLSLLFGLVLWLVEISVIALSAVLTVTSLGLALLWLIPAWILGFWLLPAFAMMITADFVPQYLTVNGFVPAALAGLVMLAISFLTRDEAWTRREA